MTPTQKAPELDNFITKLMGKSRIESIINNKCISCDGDANEFDDEISAREYAISSLCQKCQNLVFNSFEE